MTEKQHMAKQVKTAAPGEEQSEDFPHGYTRELAQKVLDAVAEHPMALKKICEPDGMPSKTTVRRWIADDVDGFRDKYTREKLIGLEQLSEDLLAISDDGENDYGESGQLNGEHIQRSKLRVDSRKWLLSKLLPKKYGDRQTVEHEGKLQTEDVTISLEERVAKSPELREHLRKLIDQ